MALLGGGVGGAGNPVGGSFTGPSTGLELVGSEDGVHKFAYAYSGLIGANASLNPITMFEFTTGNYLFVGRITFNGYQDDDNPSLGIVRGVAQVFLNSNPVSQLMSETSNPDSNLNATYNDIIIPSYTLVKVELRTTDTDADRFASALFTGRIYK